MTNKEIKIYIFNKENKFEKEITEIDGIELKDYFDNILPRVGEIISIKNAINNIVYYHIKYVNYMIKTGSLIVAINVQEIEGVLRGCYD